MPLCKGKWGRAVSSQLDLARSVLILKTGAAGDVVRTTPVLSLMEGKQVTWLVAPKNAALLPQMESLRVIESVSDLEGSSQFDFVLSLEDDYQLLQSVYGRIDYGAVVGTFVEDGLVKYTTRMQKWFDMSLVSRFGLGEANRLKLQNRDSYQSHVFEGLGAKFNSEEYRIPQGDFQKSVSGDIAFAPFSGPTWPMKNWSFFDELIAYCGSRVRVNVLPVRSNVLTHVADIKSHKLVVCNDSLPMHLALGSNVPCVAFFNCTSPWEIHDYKLLRKVVSPKLSEYFYARYDDDQAKTAITFEQGLQAVCDQAELAGINIRQ